jgi:hypothetical protein
LRKKEKISKKDAGQFLHGDTALSHRKIVLDAMLFPFFVTGYSNCLYEIKYRISTIAEVSNMAAKKSEQGKVS